MSQRERRSPSYLTDYHYSTASTSSPQLPSSQVLYPLSKYISYATLSPSHKTYSLNLTSDFKLGSYAEAVKFECWRDAMTVDIRGLEENLTWKIVDLPYNAMPIRNKWVYKIKRLSDGSVERYKAQLVAKGYNQVEGLVYFDTFT